MITMTDQAVRKIQALLAEKSIPDGGLRVKVVGGGCSGFQYALDFTNEARSNDFVYQVEDLTVYVDAVSARYLEGTQIDYVMGTAGAGFKFHNPKAVGSCGCGSSFAV